MLNSKQRSRAKKKHPKIQTARRDPEYQKQSLVKRAKWDTPQPRLEATL